MRRIFGKSAVPVVCALALYLVFGLGRVTAQAPNAKTTETQHQDTRSLLQNALDQLQGARSDLKSADTDKQGHKIKAETAVDTAMNEVKAALSADYPGKTNAK